MVCVKTGAQVYLEEFNLFMIGDMHQFEAGHFVFRATGHTDFKPIRSHLHYKVQRIAEWWRDHPINTIIPARMIDHGYDGIPAEGYKDETVSTGTGERETDGDDDAGISGDSGAVSGDT